MCSMPSTSGSGGRTGNWMNCPASSPRFPSSKISTSKAGRFSSPTAITVAHCKRFDPENEEGLEDLLQSAVRIALEYRMDLMNNRAQLYDFWRQIRVTANALKGILNLTLANNVYTPVTSSNPFAFLSQAKQFSLDLNAELPLVRVAERNNFRTALINYQRRSEIAANRGRQSENPAKERLA